MYSKIHPDWPMISLTSSKARNLSVSRSCRIWATIASALRRTCKEKTFNQFSFELLDEISNFEINIICQ